MSCVGWGEGHRRYIRLRRRHSVQRLCKPCQLRRTSDFRRSSRYSWDWSKAHFSLAEISSHHIATLEGPRSNNELDLNFVLFSPDGTTLASGLRTGVKLWDVATRTSFPTLSQSSVSSAAFSPDGTILASGSYTTSEANVKLWNVATRTLVATLDGHTGGPTGVHSLAFSPGGDTLALVQGIRRSNCGTFLGEAFSPPWRAIRAMCSLWRSPPMERSLPGRGTARSSCGM